MLIFVDRIKEKPPPISSLIRVVNIAVLVLVPTVSVIFFAYWHNFRYMVSPRLATASAKRPDNISS